MLLYIDDIDAIKKKQRHIQRELWAKKGFVSKHSFDQYQTNDENFIEFLDLAKSFSKINEPIIIMGETGSGKEVLAQSIHNYSERADKAFVAINCAAIPENLLESELFGYNEGAFTGAKKGGKEGFFEMASGGTLFLDEIGDMSLNLQSKLLRVIQEKQVLRLGGEKQIPIDVRIIVATNQNLWKMVVNGTFRMDLFYRLDVLELEIPTLRERPADIVLMFEMFIKQISPSMMNFLQPIWEDVSRLLISYDWPGNVRELENFVHSLSAIYKSKPDRQMDFSYIKRALNIKRSRSIKFTSKKINMEEVPITFNINELKEKDEAKKIQEALITCKGNIGKSADFLGIHRSTLYRKMKKLEKAK